MNPVLLDGRLVAQTVRQEILQSLEGRQLRPCLAALLVGDDPASHLYVGKKQEACREVGFDSRLLHLPADMKESALLEAVEELARDASVHGILLQLPLPAGLRARNILEAIPPEKDVDGLTSVSVGRLNLDEPGFLPCTPAGVLALLDHYQIPLEGKEAVVVGRSQLVGRPLAQLLLRRNCTVTLCHSRTRNLESVTSRAEILIAAMGRPASLGLDAIREGAVVIDVGTNFLSKDAAPSHFFQEGTRTARLLERNGRVLVGDFDPFAMREKASAYTPVPGGVGPMTIAMLLKNTLQAALLQSGQS